MAVRLETVRVKLGARILDLVRPGWADEIDLGTLRLERCSRCVLGQLFGNYWKGAETVFALRAPAGEYAPHEAAIAAGFHDGDGKAGVCYGNLQPAWVREIKRRRTARNPVSA